MIVGASLEAEGRVLERADQEGGCSAAACAASSSTAQGLQGMLVIVQVCSVRVLRACKELCNPKLIGSAWLLVSYRTLGSTFVRAQEETREPAEPPSDSSGNLIRRIRHQRADAFQEGLRLHRPKTSNWLKDQLIAQRVACLRDCCK